MRLKFLLLLLLQTKLLFCVQAQTKEKNYNLLTNLRYAASPTDVYAKDTSSDYCLDLYLPSTNQAIPLIIFVHGGGFSGGDKGGTKTVCAALAAKGFAVASINYRLYLKHHKIAGASASANMSKGLPAGGHFHPALQKAVQTAAADAQVALNWAIKNAGRYHINPNTIAIAGGSAGAMTALYAAYVDSGNAGKIKAVINLWGGMENVNVIKKKAPPLLTYHGDEDKLINVTYAYALDEQMKKIGNKQSRLTVIKGQGHAIYNYIAREKCGEIAAYLNSIYNNAK